MNEWDAKALGLSHMPGLLSVRAYLALILCGRRLVNSFPTWGVTCCVLLLTAITRLWTMHPFNQCRDSETVDLSGIFPIQMHSSDNYFTSHLPSQGRIRETGQEQQHTLEFFLIISYVSTIFIWFPPLPLFCPASSFPVPPWLPLKLINSLIMMHICAHTHTYIENNLLSLLGFAHVCMYLRLRLGTQ